MGVGQREGGSLRKGTCGCVAQANSQNCIERFRKEGLERPRIADLMKAAGLTHGGFYFHFASKEALVREAMYEAFDQTNGRIARRVEYGLAAIVRGYLAPGGRDRPESVLVTALWSHSFFAGLSMV